MKQAFLLVMCIAAFSFAYQNGWQNISSQDEAPVSIYVLRSDSTTVDITFSIPGFYLEQDEDSTDYWHVSLKDEYTFTDSLGLPELPILRKNIAIPECDSYQVNVYYFSKIILDNFRVYPVPLDSCDSSGCQEIFSIDSSFYYGQNPDTLYPAFTIETSIGYLRKQRILKFKLSPFRYDADDNSMTVYSQIEFKVDFYGPSETICTDNDIMNNVCRATLLNSTHLPIMAAALSDSSDSGSYAKYDTVPGIFSDSCDYLIIVADTLWNSIYVDSIAIHRGTTNNYRVLAVKYEAIDTHYSSETYPTEYEKLAQFIQDVYDSCDGVELDSLGYVLLLGDANNDYDAYNYLIPGYYLGDSRMFYGADMYYGCIAGEDDIADVMIGRFPAGDSTELANMIEKTIHNEPIDADSLGWRRLLALRGCYNESGHHYFGWRRANDFAECFQDNFYKTYIGCGDSSYDATPSDCFDTVITTIPDLDSVKVKSIEQLKNNYFWVTYTYHGGIGFGGHDGFCNVRLGNADTIAVIDSTSPCFIFANTCLTASFFGEGNTDCFGEYWLKRSSIHGAIGYIGAMATSYGFPMDSLLINNLFTAGEISCMAFWRDGHNAFELLGDPAYNLVITDFNVNLSRLDGQLTIEFDDDSIYANIGVVNINRVSDTLDSVEVFIIWHKYCEDVADTTIIWLYSLPPATWYFDTFSNVITYDYVVMEIDPNNYIQEIGTDEHIYRGSINQAMNLSDTIGINMIYIRIFDRMGYLGLDSRLSYYVDSFAVLRGGSLEVRPADTTTSYSDVRLREGGFAFISDLHYGHGIDVTRDPYDPYNFRSRGVALPCSLSLGWNMIGFDNFKIPANLYYPLTPDAFGWDTRTNTYTIVDTLYPLRAYWLFSFIDTVLPLSCELFNSDSDTLFHSSFHCSLLVFKSEDSVYISFGIDDSATDGVDPHYDSPFPPEHILFDADSDFGAWFYTETPVKTNLTRAINKLKYWQTTYELALCGPKRSIQTTWKKPPEDYDIYFRSEQGQIYDLKTTDEIVLTGKQKCKLFLVYNHHSNSDSLWAEVDTSTDTIEVVRRGTETAIESDFLKYFLLPPLEINIRYHYIINIA